MVTATKAKKAKAKGENQDWGEEREDSSEGMKELWRVARLLDEESPVEGGRWVPWRAVRIDPTILPRLLLDSEVVSRYAASFNDLPPISVQRGTFTLIDGHHRLSAAAEATRDHIRIHEEDVADEDLADEATRRNVQHGLPLSKAERMAAGRAILARHHPDGTGTGLAWTEARIAAWSGLSVRTVTEWVAEGRQAMERAAASSAADGPQDATEGMSDAEPVQAHQPAVQTGKIARLGTDGKVYQREASGWGKERKGKKAPPAYQNRDALRNVTALPAVGRQTDVAALLTGTLTVYELLDLDAVALTRGALDEHLPRLAEQADALARWAGALQDAVMLVEDERKTAGADE